MKRIRVHGAQGAVREAIRSMFVLGGCFRDPLETSKWKAYR